MTQLNAAVIQMTSGPDRTQNLAAAGELLKRAADDGAELAVLPENFSAMGLNEADRCVLAEPEGNGPVQDFLAEQAQRHRLWIVGGTIPLVSDDPQRPFASALVFTAEGQRIARYDKLHLFDVGMPDNDEAYRESAHTRAGSGPALLPTPWGKLSVTICYDVRFPETFRVGKEAPDLIALPGAFTETTGRAHWSVLLRARAIENLCAVLAAAQTGTHANGRQTYGHSMIVSAWGRVAADAGTAPGYVVAGLDLADQAAIRQRFPVLEHRRL